MTQVQATDGTMYFSSREDATTRGDLEEPRNWKEQEFTAFKGPALQVIFYDIHVEAEKERAKSKRSGEDKKVDC